MSFLPLIATVAAVILIRAETGTGQGGLMIPVHGLIHIRLLLRPDDFAVKSDLSPLMRGQLDGTLEAIVRTRETSLIARVGDPNRVHIIKHISHNKKKSTRISGKVKCLFALPAHEIFKVVPFGGLIVVDVDLLAASAASAGNHFSVGLENLFNLNHISHNRKQYITDLKNCNPFFQLFLFFF